MEVLSSPKAFLDKYVTRVPNVFSVAKSAMAGTAVTGTSLAVAGTAAANASAWSLGSGLPLIGSFCAGKAAAAGVAAALGAGVLLPALALGGGAAYYVYRKRGKRSFQKTSGVSHVAHAFARVACLPMMSLAVTVCNANPANRDAVRDYVVNKLGSWGYAESYARAGFDEAMKYSPEEINGQYEWAMRQLESGSTDGIGATPRELPADAVRGFAEDFRKGFEACIV